MIFFFNIFFNKNKVRTVFGFNLFKKKKIKYKYK